MEGQPFTQRWAKYALQQYKYDDDNISLHQFFTFLHVTEKVL
jgi:hypothetical protein